MPSGVWARLKHAMAGTRVMQDRGLIESSIALVSVFQLPPVRRFVKVAE